MDATYTAVVDALRADPRVRLVYEFGSATRQEDPRDLDVAVLTDPALGPAGEAELRARLPATSPPVDLVLLDRAPIVLRWEIVTGGRCLLARDDAERAEFEIGVLSRFQDFQPVRRVQQDYLRRRVEDRRGAPR